ncbi:hypothetical protein N9Y67_01985 [Pseudomonadota bacterium]|nr:hypothetical protein [Pseudomonadota bacterium]
MSNEETNFMPTLPVSAVVEGEGEGEAEESVVEVTVAVSSGAELGEIIADRVNGSNVRDKAIEGLSSEIKEEVLKIAADHNLKSDDPVWLLVSTMGRTVDAIDAISGVKKDLVDSIADSAAAELLSVKVEAAKVEAEINEYGAEAKKYIERILAAATKNMVKKINGNVATIEERMTGAMISSLVETARESAKQTAKIRYDLNKPYRWAALAIIGCLFIGGGSYYAGSESYHYSKEYIAAKGNETKWADFVKHWQNATPKEKAAIESMMERSK